MILITGATGFVGNHLCGSLLQKGYALRALLRPGSRVDDLPYPEVERVLGNPFNPESLKDAFAGVEAVIHCAGALKGLGYEDYYRGNVLYTRNLLQAAKTCAPGLRKFVFISSQAAAGPSKRAFPDAIAKTEAHAENPVSFYGATKLDAEHEIEESGLPYVILRPSSIYGPKDHEFFPLFKMAKKGFLVLPGNGKNLLNLIHVKDFIKAIELGLESTLTHEKYHLCGPGIFSQLELARAAFKATGRKGVILKIPAWIARGFGYFNSFLGLISGKPLLLNHQKIREALQEAWVLDSSKARIELGFHPEIGLQEGFAETFKWYLKEGWL